MLDLYRAPTVKRILQIDICFPFLKYTFELSLSQICRPILQFSFFLQDVVFCFLIGCRILSINLVHVVSSVQNALQLQKST